MILKYFPDDKFFFDDACIEFKEYRSNVRKIMNKAYKEENRRIPRADPHDEPILMRRDIYNLEDAGNTFFFLSYDHDDLLTEIEVHRCQKIEVGNVVFDFNDDLDTVALELSKYSEISILSEGEILFNDLKMVLSDRRKMGGEGSEVNYFYCSSDISHLI